MEPSSLILVAIIGVWAAYLVPTWLRKRDDLVQSRATDRFSSGLRVLNRRRRSARSGHRSGDAVLASPRVIVDADGELLFIAGDRAKAAELQAVGETAVPASVAAASKRQDLKDVDAVKVDAVKVKAHAVKADAVKADAVKADAMKVHPETPAQKIAVAAAKVERVARVQVSARVKTESTPMPAKAAVDVEKPVVPAKAVVQPKPETPSKPAPEPKPVTDVKPAVSADPPAKAPAGFRVAASARSTAGKSAPSTQRPPGAPKIDITARQHDLDAATVAGRTAATRRARIMALLIVACISSWGVASVVSLWIGLPATILLVLHAVASRAAALRSREHLAVLTAQLQAAETARSRAQPQRKPAPNRRPATHPATARQAPSVRRTAVDDSWQPVPVPPPTYTLKPAAPRPEPAPLELPAHKPAVAHKPATPAADAAAVSRGALPRTAADIERILALDAGEGDGYEHRTA